MEGLDEAQGHELRRGQGHPIADLGLGQRDLEALHHIPHALGQSSACRASVSACGGEWTNTMS
jgi:hypothetical protein